MLSWRFEGRGSRNRTEREPRAKSSRRSIDRALREFLRGGGGGRPGRGDRQRRRGRGRITKKQTTHKAFVALRERIERRSVEQAAWSKLATQIRWETAVIQKCDRYTTSRHAIQHELRRIWMTYLAHRGRPPDLSRNNYTRVTISLS